jgi:hypothetical protein
MQLQVGSLVVAPAVLVVRNQAATVRLVSTLALVQHRVPATTSSMRK